MTLQELKDNYAQQQGFLEWEELHMSCQFEGKNLDFAKHIDDVIILAQQEALKKAALSIEKEIYNTMVYDICCMLITSENNLIK